MIFETLHLLFINENNHVNVIFQTLHLLFITENNHVNVIFQTLHLLFRISWSYTVKMKRFY